MKDIGLVGLPLSGKSTLFTALTKMGAAGGRSNQAVVSVQDPRVETLAELERSRKVVHAQVRFVDVAGALSAQGLAQLREADALAIVLRAFGPDADSGRDMAAVRDELVLADLAVVDSALENARRRLKGGRSAGPDLVALERAHEALSDETPLREADLEPEHVLELRSVAPLTLKPWIPVVNLEEGATIESVATPEDAALVWARLEAETAGMAEDEARALLKEFGVEEPGLDRVIAASYRAIDLVTFLTTGDDETRAWDVRRGATAQEAAGVIHSDFARGFIRAEVVSYDDLVAAGSWNEAKNRGLLRVEGRDYEVREGDVLHVRFNV
jgi:GTP-binding protein YchF